MKYQKNITDLIYYALISIRGLDKSGDFQVITESLNELLHGLTPDKKILSDEEANARIVWSDQEHSLSRDIPVIFTSDDLGIIKNLIHNLMNLAVKMPDENNNHVLIAKYLHPLLSQDVHTNSIGWDLEEYMDWYFTDPSEEVRQTYAEDLLSEWDLQINRR